MKICIHKSDRIRICPFPYPHLLQNSIPHSYLYFVKRIRIFTTSIFKLSEYGYYHDHFQFSEYECRIIWTIRYQVPPLVAAPARGQGSRNCRRCCVVDVSCAQAAARDSEVHAGARAGASAGAEPAHAPVGGRTRLQLSKDTLDDGGRQAAGVGSSS